MKQLLAILAIVPALASAQTIKVLDPGPGTSYLAVWCGGQTVNAVAEDFNGANPVTIVKVGTRCNGSGRGAKVHNYLTCARVTYSSDGSAIVATEIIASGSWLAGNPVTVFCPSTDAGAVYENNGATLSTSTFPVGSRAVLTLP